VLDDGRFAQLEFRAAAAAASFDQRRRSSWPASKTSTQGKLRLGNEPLSAPKEVVGGGAGWLATGRSHPFSLL